MEEFITFMDILYTHKLNREEEDDMRWNHTRSGKFEVSSYYKLLSPGGNPIFPWKSVWQAKVPHKVAFFTWLVALGKNLMIDNLRHRKVCIFDWCLMRKRAGESGDHLFLH